MERHPRRMARSRVVHWRNARLGGCEPGLARVRHQRLGGGGAQQQLVVLRLHGAPLFVCGRWPRGKHVRGAALLVSGTCGRRALRHVQREHGQRNRLSRRGVFGRGWQLWIPRGLPDVGRRRGRGLVHHGASAARIHGTLHVHQRRLRRLELQGKHRGAALRRPLQLERPPAGQRDIYHGGEYVLRPMHH